MKKTVYCMRHGQTLFNLHQRIQGWVDSPLTELGKEQALYTRKHYFEANQVEYDHVYTSTSERACDTAELVTDMPYVRKKGLKEMNFGKMDGEPEYLHPPFDQFNTFYPTVGGESNDQVVERFTRTLKEILANEDHESVLVVTHGGAMINFWETWQHLSHFPFTSHLKNCCVLKFEYDTEDETFTCTDYFEGMPAGL